MTCTNEMSWSGTHAIIEYSVPDREEAEENKQSLSVISVGVSVLHIT